MISSRSTPRFAFLLFVLVTLRLSDDLVAQDLVVGSNASGQSVILSSGTNSYSNTYLGYAASASNNFLQVVNTTTILTNSSEIYVGYAGAGNILLISNGAGVFDKIGTIGMENFSSNNQIIVTGIGSFWRGGTNTIGYFGRANSLVISDGGNVYDQLVSVGLKVSSSNNSVLVTGTNSLWSNNTIYLGVDGGGNSLTISNGATNIGSGSVGLNSTSSSNSVVVTGVNSLWTSSATINIGDAGAANSLVISSGGRVNGSTAVLGAAVTSTRNSVLVTGSNSAWNNGATLSIGYRGSSNTLTISNAASVRAANGQIGYFSNSVGNQVLVSGTNSRWSNASSLFVGVDGSSNSVVITNGALVFNQYGMIGYSGVSSNNAVILSGTGSTWSNSINSYIGYSGSRNTLVISNGARMTDQSGSLGFAATSSNNSALVTGTNSRWINTYLYVGLDGASNSLVISNGAMVQARDSWIGFNASSMNNAVLVTGAGSIWTNSATLVVALSGGGVLTIANGGAVIAPTIVVASGSNSIGTLNIGTVGGADTAGSITAGSISFGSGSGSINFNQRDQFSLSNSISGIGSLSQLGIGTTILSGTNTYTGPTRVQAGTLRFGSFSSLYGGDTSQWTASNLIVSNGATASFAVGGDAPFTDDDISQLVAIGSSNGGFLRGSCIGLDSTGTNFIYSGVIKDPNGGSNSLSLGISGSGTISLTASNIYSGRTVIGSGSTLMLGNTSTLSGTTNILINGGTLHLGGNGRTNTVAATATLQLSGGSLSMGAAGATSRLASQTFSTLTLTASSVIDFSALPGISSLTVEGIRGLDSTNQLSIWNWNGTTVWGDTSTTGGAGAYTRLYIGAGAGDLSADQLGRISFYSGSGTGFLGTGSFFGSEIIPVPEPAVLVSGLFLVSALFFRRVCRFAGRSMSAPVHRHRRT